MIEGGFTIIPYIVLDSQIGSVFPKNRVNKSGVGVPIKADGSVIWR
jgi:hypothetical protein